MDLITIGIAALGGLQLLFFLLMKSYVSALSSKEGEIDAIHRNLERVLLHQERQTAAVKAIEAQIAGGLWLDQERWKLKRDVYVSLLQHYAEQERRFRVLVDEQRKPPWDYTEYAAFRKTQRQFPEYIRARACAPMVLAPAILDKIKRLEEDVREQERDTLLKGGPPGPLGMFLYHACQQLGLTAGEDLGAFAPEAQEAFQAQQIKEVRVQRILESLREGTCLSMEDRAFWLEYVKESRRLLPEDNPEDNTQ